MAGNVVVETVLLLKSYGPKYKKRTHELTSVMVIPKTEVPAIGDEGRMSGISCKVVDVDALRNGRFEVTLIGQIQGHGVMVIVDQMLRSGWNLARIKSHV